MIYIRKLLFAPIFLLCLYAALYFLKPLLISYAAILSLSIDDFLKIIYLSGFILLASFSYITFATLVQKWPSIFVVALLAAALPVLLITSPLSYVLSIGIFVLLLFSYLLLENKLKTYLTFQPTMLLTPAIKNLASMLVLVIAFGYYLSMNREIKANGVQIPDSLIDSVMKIASPQDSTSNVKGAKYLAQLPQITPDQLDYLKQHPELLQQQGIDPKVLDSIGNSTPAPKTSGTPKSVTPSTTAITSPLSNIPIDTTALAKNLIKSQFQSIIKPYEGIIPAILGILFFFTIQSIISLLSIFLGPLIYLTFKILERTHFIVFTKEMREVKKMVV